MKKSGLLLLSVLAVACSPRVAPPPAVIPAPSHDTLIVRDYRVDSVYVHESERTQHDTVYLTRIKEHYSILRDTIERIHTDSIPVIREVAKPTPYVPRWYKWPALLLYGICAVAIAYAIARVAIKLYF